MNPATHNHRAGWRVASLLVLVTLVASACGRDLWGSYNFDPTSGPSTTVTTAETATPTSAPTFTASATIPLLPDPPQTASPTATPSIPSPTDTPGSGPTDAATPGLVYTSQPGDSPAEVAAHFGVRMDDVYSAGPWPATGFLNVGTPLVISNYLPQTPTTPPVHIIPDSEVVNSPTAVEFDVLGYVQGAGGRLGTYREYLPISNWTTGGQAVQRLSYESSTNPRLLLTYIQYYTGWVDGPSKPGLDDHYPLGYQGSVSGLYNQMRLLVQDLAAGYYGWRSGKLTQLTFPDGTTLRLAPDLNSGTVALQYMFSRRLNYAEWLQAVNPTTGFMALYTQMFGDPWERDRSIGPLLPSGLIQPDFTLPFETGFLWSLTGGPHSAWEQEKVHAALDFAPGSATSGCSVSNAWAVAVAPGLIVRSRGGYVLLDLDGDGYEQTGWVVLYMHIAPQERVQQGTWVDAGDHIGHPSCEGGQATGTHLHIARKFNGEWIGAGGPLPFVLSGWTAHYGFDAYYGTLTRGDQIVTSSNISSHESNIIRQPGE